MSDTFQADERAAEEARLQLIEQIKRAAIEMMIIQDHADTASMLIDARFDLLQDERDGEDYFSIALPPALFGAFKNGKAKHSRVATDAIQSVATGHLTDWNGRFYQPGVAWRVQLSDPDPDWVAKTKALLEQGGATNQGAISELVKQRNGQSMLTYHELKFASASEIRIAQELENRGVLFFPLAVGVVSETGVGYKDRREVDFLVCQDGVFGVLEVSYHPNRYEQDAEKNAWIKRHGVLCVEHYSAERCYNQSAAVVDEFLAVLAKYKR